MPNLFKKLEKYKANLINRREVKSGQIQYFHLQWSRDERFFIPGNKVVCATRTEVPAATYTEDNFYGSRALNFIKTNRISLKYLTAILNSKISYFWLKYKGKLTGDLLQIDKSQLISIPIKKINNTTPFEIIVDYIIFLISLKKNETVDKYVPNHHITQQFEEIIDAMVFELYFEENFKKAGITFIPYVERDFPSIDGLSDEEKIETIRSVYQKLRQKDNEIMNNLKLMNIRLADLIGPIKAVG